MAKYSIQDTSLIAIGDAIRNKTGEHTRPGTYMETIPEVMVSKTPNATGFETHDGGYPIQDTYDVIRFPGASGIRVDFSYETKSSSLEGVRIASGVYGTLDFPSGDCKLYAGNTDYIRQEQLTFQNTDVITIQFKGKRESEFLGYYAECRAVDADGNLMGEYQIEKECEVPNTFTPIQMATEIEALSIMPSEAFVITGNCQYRFANNGWNWFIENYGDKIITKDITNAMNMFLNTSELKNIPFDLCFKPTNVANVAYTLSSLFSSCINLVSVPKLVEAKPSDMSNIFSRCQNLVELSEAAVADIDWSYIDNLKITYTGSRSNTFDNCHLLRKFPMSFLAHGNPVGNYSSSIYYNGFNYCYNLAELINLPIQHRNASWTSNAFYSTFNYCYRLKDIIFETNEDGSPIKIDTWTKQAITLASSNFNVGFANSAFGAAAYGFTVDTQVTDDISYQALKDNPDWWTKDINYSRYNHDSAVRTINSLPDLSAKGSNTITFRGAAGALTDGGAINTLTEEEIAVAAAKGWTVTLV